MEEQRQRQEEEARRVTAASATEAGIPTPTQDGNKNGILLLKLLKSVFAKGVWFRIERIGIIVITNISLLCVRI